jgi:splicing factor U2AF subunit
MQYQDTGGAAYLARIYGTEEDQVNCPFYNKIGACRHGERCSRVHNKPTFSQTVVIPHMYNSPYAAMVLSGGDLGRIDMDALQAEFDDFYAEVFEECSKFGEIEEMQVAENLGEHLLGNVYVRYEDEEEAEKCLTELYGRNFAGRQLVCEYSPVVEFTEARCRQYDEGHCSRGGYCNFMHVKPVSKMLRDHLKKRHGYGKKSSDMERGYGGGQGREGDRRSRDGDRRRDHDRYRDDRRDHDRRDHDRRDHRHRDRRDYDRDHDRRRRRDSGSRDRRRRHRSSSGSRSRR